MYIEIPIDAQNPFRQAQSQLAMMSWLPYCYYVAVEEYLLDLNLISVSTLTILALFCIWNTSYVTCWLDFEIVDFEIAQETSGVLPGRSPATQ